MPDVTIAAPAAVMPADRLTIDVIDARAAQQVNASNAGYTNMQQLWCMSEE